MIEIITPFPSHHWPLLWKWAREFPELNFDDDGPATLREFMQEMDIRSERETIWQVRVDGIPVGAIAFLPLSKKVGTFHGICFAELVHGTGVAKQAVRMVITHLFSNGIDKICACYAVNNPKIDAFLTRLGFKQEGLHRKHALRGGERIDMKVVALFAEEET